MLKRKNRNKGRVNNRYHIETLTGRTFEDFLSPKDNFLIEQAEVLTDSGFVSIKNINIDCIHHIYTLDVDNKKSYQRIKSFSKIPSINKIVTEYMCNDGEYYFVNGSIYNPYDPSYLIQRYNDLTIFKTNNYEYKGSLYSMKFTKPTFIIVRFNNGYTLFPV